MSALKFKSGAELDRSRIGDGARPTSKVRAGDVGIVRQIPSYSTSSAAGVNEAMHVKGVEELCPELKIQPLAKARVFDKGDIRVLEIRPPHIGYARAVSGVAELRERRKRLESIDVEERSFAGIEVVNILQERICSLFDCDPAALPKLARQIALAGTEEERNAARVAIDRTHLPAA